MSDTVFQVLVPVSVLLFWFSISLTEAWKWRMDRKQPDSNPIINYRSYHVWRGVTNASVLVLALLLSGKVGVVLILSAFVAGWSIYELTMGWVEYGRLEAERPMFHIMGKTYKRPDPLFYKVVLASSLFLVAWAVVL